jgi:hypothetical protein
VQQQFPGLVFAPGGPVDAHHGQARFTWRLGAPDAEPAVISFDVADIDADGRIATVLGFLDKVPGRPIGLIHRVPAVDGDPFAVDEAGRVGGQLRAEPAGSSRDQDTALGH